MNQAVIAVPPTRVERWLMPSIVVIALIGSGLITKDHLTWLLEVIWAMVGLALVFWNWKTFPLTRLLCWLLVLHAMVLIHGGAYT
jgi:putative membrane protein